jgi:hypothetical protein
MRVEFPAIDEDFSVLEAAPAPEAGKFELLSIDLAGQADALRHLLPIDPRARISRAWLFTLRFGDE